MEKFSQMEVGFLNFTMLGNSFLNIRSKIIKKMRTFNWKHGFFRKRYRMADTLAMRIVGGKLKGKKN